MGDGEENYHIRFIQIENRVRKAFNLAPLCNRSVFERPALRSQLNFSDDFTESS